MFKKLKSYGQTALEYVSSGWNIVKKTGVAAIGAVTATWSLLVTDSHAALTAIDETALIADMDVLRDFVLAIGGAWILFKFIKRIFGT